MDISALLQQHGSSMNVGLLNQFQTKRIDDSQKALNTSTQLDPKDKYKNEYDDEIKDTAEVSKEAIEKFKYNNDDDIIMETTEHKNVDFARARAVNAYRRFAS